MRILTLTPIVILSGCFCLPCEEEVPDQFFEETYLSYRQPSRDASYPAMSVLRDEGNGHYWELPRHEQTDNTGKPFEWGKRYRVKIRTSYNSYTRHSSRRVDEVLEVKEDLSPKEFRLYSISAPFFGEKGRSFVDGKELTCGKEVCAALDKAIAAGERFDIVAGFSATAAGPIVVKAIEEPTCYSGLDCRARDSCCETDDGFQCVEWEACTDDRRVGYDRAEYDSGTTDR